MEQDTVNKSGENIRVRIKGRHDPIIVPRAVVVVEAMAAITLLDMLFASIPSRMDNLTVSLTNKMDMVAGRRHVHFICY